MKPEKIRKIILETVDAKRRCFLFTDILNAFAGKNISKESIQREIKYLASEELITGEIDESNYIIKHDRDNPHTGHSIQTLEITSKGRNWLESKKLVFGQYWLGVLSGVIATVIGGLIINFVTKK